MQEAIRHELDLETTQYDHLDLFAEEISLGEQANADCCASTISSASTVSCPSSYGSASCFSSECCSS